MYGVNDDGKTINLDKLKRKTLEEVIKVLETYLNKNHSNVKEGIIGFTFINKTSDDKYENEVKDTVSKGLNNARFLYLKGTEEDIAIARKKGNNVYLNEEVLDELQDELGDKTESDNKNDNEDDD